LCSREAHEADLLDEDVEREDRDHVLEREDVYQVDDEQLYEEGKRFIQ